MAHAGDGQTIDLLCALLYRREISLPLCRHRFVVRRSENQQNTSAFFQARVCAMPLFRGKHQTQREH